MIYCTEDFVYSVNSCCVEHYACVCTNYQSHHKIIINYDSFSAIPNDC